MMDTPSLGMALTSNAPPTSSAHARMLPSPRPGATAPGSNPAPVSRIVTVRTARSTEISMMI